jgi:hypothetical protein
VPSAPTCQTSKRAKCQNVPDDKTCQTSLRAKRQNVPNVKTCQMSKRARRQNVPNDKTCPRAKRAKRAHVPNVLMCHSAHIPRPQVPGAPTSIFHECRVSPRVKRPLPTYQAYYIITPVTPRVFGYPHITKPDDRMSTTSQRHTCQLAPRAKRPRVPGAMVMENSCRARHCVGRPDFIIHSTVQTVFSSLPFHSMYYTL